MPEGNLAGSKGKAQKGSYGDVGKKKKVKVKRKPLPVPSIAAAAYEEPKPQSVLVVHPKAGKPKGKGKPRPHGGHLPTQFEYMDPTDFMFPSTHRAGSARDRKIKAYNQQREANRRLDNRATQAQLKQEREQRRQHIRQILESNPELRQGAWNRDAVQSYIQNGPDPQTPHGLDLLKKSPGIARAIAEGGVGYEMQTLRNIANGHLGRELERELDLVGGKALANTVMHGDASHPGATLAELATLWIPIKGGPSAATVALRALMGARRFEQAKRAGMTIAEAAREAEAMRPVMTSRALRRQALRASDAPRSSSWLAGKIAGDRKGTVAKIIRNDPGATRKIVKNGAVIETPADLSRTWKFAVRPLLDRSRGVTGFVPGVSSTEKLFGRTLKKRLEVAQFKYQALLTKAHKALPNVVDAAGWPGVYALRAVLKNVPISEMIKTTEDSLKVAMANGDKLKTAALRMHLAYFKEAAQYVETVDGKTVLRGDAPISMEDLRSAIGNVSAQREKIIGDSLGMLSEARADMRIQNEQLLYFGATLQTGAQHAKSVFAENPVRQAILEHGTRNLTPEQRDYTMTVLDARARQAYENEVETQKGYADFKRKSAAAMEDGEQKTALLEQAQRHEDRAKTLSPSFFYDHIEEFADEIPPDVIQAMKADHGAPGQDWLFSIHDSSDEVSAASHAIAREIQNMGLKLPPELDTPEKLARGVENVFKLAADGEHGKDWYTAAARVVMQISEAKDVSPKQVAQLVAIFSQAADTVSNVTFVFDAINQFQRHGDVFTGRFPGRQGDEALAVLRGEGYEGRKRNSFYANILRHLPGMEDEYAQTIKEMAAERGAPINHPVTVDRWVVRMFRPGSKKDVPAQYYDTFETLMQMMAKHVGMEPEQLQAAAWVSKKQADLDKSIAEGGRRTVRHVAGGGDAFEHGMLQQLKHEEEHGATVVHPQAKRLANQANKKWGGFTVDENLRPAPEVGYSVSYSLTERKFKLHGLKGADIEKFRDEYGALLKDKNNYIGGFSDDLNEAGDATEVTLLSVTRHFKTKAAAMKFAREQGQETVYEYKTGDGIRTGLTRDEQAQIIKDLDPASNKGGPVSDIPRLTALEQTRDEFFAKAARDFGYSKKSMPTDAQKEKAERWLAEHAHEHPDEPLVKEYEALPQNAPAEDPFWMQGKVEQALSLATEAGDGPTHRIMGLWMNRSKQLWLSEGAHPLDYWHEIVHVMDTENLWSPEVKKEIYKFLEIDPTQGPLTREQAEDIADMFEAMVIGFDPTKTKLPDNLKRALLAMKTDVWNSRRGFKDSHAMLAKMPEQLRMRLEDVLAVKDEGLSFRGARPTFRGGDGVYTPEVQGLPFGWVNANAPRRMFTQWNRMIQGQKVASLTPADAHLEQSFTGALIHSGLWDKDVTRGPLEGLLKAMEIQKMSEVHQTMVKAGTEIPESTTDIMVPIDPGAWTKEMREQAGEVFKIIEAMDPSNKITAQALAKTDAAGIEQAKQVYFPGATDGSEKAFAEIAELVRTTQQPIEGIVWVPRKTLMQTGLFDKPGLKYGMGPAGSSVLGAVDFANNLAKMMTLSLNPAYYPMNMAGQAVMMGVQQGFMAPFTLVRALKAWRDFSDEQLSVIDHAAGLGLGSVVHSKGGLAKGITDATAHVSDILIDRYPRRAAFFYEARRLGYKTKAEVIDLVENPRNIDDLFTVSHRANRALVDFSTMGRMEREIATRLIFVYPWLKASTKWAGDFVADHPIQTALFAGLIYWQQQRLREAFPEGHPGYMKWFFPVKIPGEEGGTPYGFRLDQFLTPLQPMDLAAEIVYWTTPFEVPWGSNEEALSNKLNPMVEEVFKTVAGWDGFTREEVSHNIVDMFLRMVKPEDRWASYQRLAKVIKHDTHSGIYDTTQTQNWLRFFLGSIAPVNMDPQKAADYSQPRKTISVPDKTPEESADDYMKKVEEANGGPIPAADEASVRTWKSNDMVYNRTESKYKRDNEIETALSTQEKVAVLLLTIAELKPDKAELAKGRVEAALAASDDEAQAAYDELRKMLGLSQLATLDRRVSKARAEARING